MEKKQHSPLACLSKVAIFATLPKEARTALVKVSSHRIFYPKGSMIRQPFDGKNGMLVIDQGSAKVFNLSPDGKETILNILNKGDIDGQDKLFTSNETENFVQALQDSWICSVNKNDFQTLLKKTPDLALQLLNNFGEKLVKVETNSVRRNTLAASERIMAYLKDLMNEQQTKSIQLPIKKKDLASYLGISPETLSRQLKQLQRNRKIKVKGKQIKIL